MQGSDAIIELLNEVLTAELTAVNQYFVDAKMCENWGYDRLVEHIRADSIDEMKDADALIDRILYLEGIPNVQRLGTVQVGESVPEKLGLALELETKADRSPTTLGSPSASPRQTTGADSCWRRSSPARRSTPTGSRPSSSSSDSPGEAFYLTQQVRS